MVQSRQYLKLACGLPTYTKKKNDRDATAMQVSLTSEHFQVHHILLATTLIVDSILNTASVLFEDSACDHRTRVTVKTLVDSFKTEHLDVSVITFLTVKICI